MMQRVLFVTAVAVAGLAGLLFGEPGRVAATLPVIGFVSVPGQAMLALACVAVVFLGAFDLGRGDTRAKLAGAVLPALLMVGLALCGPLPPDETPRWLPVAVLALVLPVILFVGCGLGEDSLPLWLNTALAPLLVYLTALVFFAGVYATRWRALYTSPTIGVGGALLALALWRARAFATYPAPVSETATAAFVVGLVLAQAAWALLFWPAPALVGGLSLLAVFYASSGVMAALRQGDVHLRMAAEYALVGLAALAVVIWVVLRVP